MKILQSGIENKFTESLKSNILSCFPNSVPFMNFFFENKFCPQFCNVLIKDNEVVSSLQAFPQKISLDGKTFAAKYIYAVATSPDFRGKGYMKELLEFTSEVEKNRKTDFLFLVPCSKSIEKYYNKFGYENFFKIRKINFSNRDFKKILLENYCLDVYSNYFWDDFSVHMEKIRNMVYNNTNHIKYCKKEISYAVNLYNKFSKGKVITTGESFAICFYCAENVLKIIDFFSKDYRSSAMLINLINKEFPSCTEYHFDICTENKLFKKYGNPEFYGMIKPLNDYSNKLMQTIRKNKKFPYLGLPLD